MFQKESSTLSSSSCPMMENTSTCMNCMKRKHSLLSDLNQRELELINEHRYVVKYKAGETIYKQGTKPLGLLCLNSGKVKISRIGENGNEQIIALKKPVDFIGFRALMGENILLSSAVALEDATICIVEKSEFFKIVENNSSLSFKIIRQLVQELNEADLRTLNLTQKHIRARLADALLLVYSIYGINEKNGFLNMDLKRSDLAALANMTTANAIRVLSSFAKENLIEVKQRKIKIINLFDLKNISLHGF